MVYSSPKAEVEDCAAFMKQVYNCNKEKPILRYIGGCSDEERDFNRCVMREHFRKRDESIQLSKGFKKGIQSLEK